jgi:hypothetical protein
VFELPTRKAKPVPTFHPNRVVELSKTFAARDVLAAEAQVVDADSADDVRLERAEVRAEHEVERAVDDPRVAAVEVDDLALRVDLGVAAVEPDSEGQAPKLIGMTSIAFQPTL